MNILITGATRGIGKAIASLFNNKDYRLFVTGRNEDLLKEYKNYCVADLATIEGMTKLGKYIQENKIDILINNAGEYIYTPAIDGFEISKLEHITRLNLEAPLYLVSKAVKNMKEN